MSNVHEFIAANALYWMRPWTTTEPAPCRSDHGNHSADQRTHARRVLPCIPSASGVSAELPTHSAIGAVSAIRDGMSLQMRLTMAELPHALGDGSCAKLGHGSRRPSVRFSPAHCNPQSMASWRPVRNWARASSTRLPVACAANFGVSGYTRRVHDPFQTEAGVLHRRRCHLFNCPVWGVPCRVGCRTRRHNRSVDDGAV